MPINKSDLIKKLADNYPNFLKKDLKKVIDIFISETKNALKRHERVELRDVFSIEPKIQKARAGRNPKTNEKINIKSKYYLLFKSSKSWAKRINEKK